jgi:alpha-galactosidase
MCPNPRLLKGSLFGINDWNYTYGKNTATGILRDADLIAVFVPTEDIRAHFVIDDGWQDAIRFPSMPELAGGLEVARPVLL